jgi:hypothetical protein
MRWIRAVLLATVLLQGGSAGADTLAFREGASLPGGGSYAGTEDTEIEGVNPTLAFGGAFAFRADADLLGAEAQALVLFSGIFGAGTDQIPYGATIVSAVLTLQAFNASIAPIGNVSVHRMTVAWDESSTWDSLGSGVQIGGETIAAADDTHTVATTGATSFDVLASLQAWSGGASNLGWVIVNDSTDGAEFRSSELLTVAERPLLSVEFTPIPEPGSLLLAGLVGAAALCARRASR